MDSLVRQCEFVAVIRSIEMLDFKSLPIRRKLGSERRIPTCQNIGGLVCNDVVKRLHEYSLYLYVCDDVGVLVR